MSLHMSLGRKSLLAAAICLTPALALTASPAAFALPSVDTTGAVSSGDNWAITPVAGGYEVTLDLAEPLPIVADAPTLLVDGVDVGYAVESSDGLSLSAFTTDPGVADAENVTKGWSSGTDKAEEGEVPSAEPETTDEKSLAKKLDAFSEANVAAVTEDPSAPGDYTVNEVEYDFGDQALALPNIGGVRGEMTGKMYLTDAPGARPTVILMHGRHTSCSTGQSNPLRWPCGSNQVNVRSYLGYEGTGRALASHGYNVLSIAVNSVNSNDNQLAPDYGANARGATVIETLEMLKKANAGTAVSYDDVVTSTGVTTTRTLDDAFARATTRTDAPAAAPTTPVSAATLAGRFDLTNVGVMGHSRGGEGATAAATLNLGLDEPFGIKAVLPLAPVDFGRMTVPNVPMAVFLPYCDGDVSNQQGQHMFDDSRGAFDDNVLRSAVWVMGANHNFFNTVWTPGMYPYATGDDWSTSDRTSTCATTNSTRMTAAQQYQVGVSYMTGFFRLAMGGETQFQEMFDGTVKPSTPSTEGFGDVRIIASQPHNTTSMIADFTEQNSLIRTYGTATAPVCMNMNGITIPQSVPLCTTTKASGASPHYAIMRFGGNVPANPLTKLTWTSGTGELRVTLPKEKRDVSGFSQLTLRTAPEELVPTGTDFTIRLVDGNGATYSTLASAINPLAVNRLPGGTNTTLNKVVLQQLTIPTASITGVNLSDIREVRFIAAVGADATANGGVYLSDLAFSNPAVGTAVTTTHTAVNLATTSVEEGSGPGTAELAVSLTRADTVPVTAYVSSVGAATGRAGIGMEKVVFAPGETCKTIEVPILGDTATSTSASTAVVIAATNTQNAVMGTKAFGYLTVREDDGITNGSASAPAVGEQGDACAEAAAAKTTGALSLSSTDLAPGAALTVSGTGYRSGESVLFTDGSTDLGRAIADSTGAVSQEITLATDAALGSHTFKAMGAGYGYTSTAEAAVLADTETALTLDPEVPAIKEPVTLKATVTGGSTAGLVTFTDGETELGTAETVEGVATLELEDGFAAGEHTVTAAFGATDTARGSESESVSFTLEKGATTVALTLGAANTTFGTGTTATATIEGAAEGVVSFGYGDTVVEVEAVEGVATLEIPATLKAGAYTVTATYLGTDTIAESAPATAAYTVAKKSTSTTLKLGKTTVKKGATVTGTVTVKGAVAGINPTGTVKIYSGSTVIREMKLSTASNGSIKISFKAPSSKGSITTKVTFVGDGNYAASSSARYAVKVTN